MKNFIDDSLIKLEKRIKKIKIIKMIKIIISELKNKQWSQML